MATKLLFIGADGVARLDRVNPYKSQVECQDGNHPITNRSIMRPDTRDGPSIMLIWQNQIAPEGEPDAATVIDATIAEADYTKVHKQKPSVSKLWVRRLMRWGHLLINIMLLGFSVSFLVFVGVILGAVL